MMDTKFEKACFESTLRTLGLKPEKMLKTVSRRPTNLVETDASTSRPTWISRGYRPNGVLLLGKNPGGGSASFETQRPWWDEKWFDAMHRLHRERSFEAYLHWLYWVAPECHRAWGIWTSIKAVLEALGQDLDEVAIGNLVPFRTSNNNVRVGDIEMAWQHDTGPMIELLRPNLIVVMTSHVDQLRKRYKGPARIERFSRANGDRYITPAGRRDLDRLRSITA